MIQLPQFSIRGMDVYSQKNSKSHSDKGHFDSVAVARWKRWSKSRWEWLRPYFIAEAIKYPYAPLNIEMTFYRSTKRTFDYNNMSHLVQDSMQFYGWIAEDDVRHMKPYFGDVVLDRVNPGVIIRILPEKPIHYDTNKFLYHEL